MILAGVLIERSKEAEFKKLGVKDSKQLTPQKREALAKEIKKAGKFHITLTHPYEIDSRTNMGINLNKIEAIKAAEIINTLNNGEKIKVILDCPSNNIPAWRSYLLTHIEKKDNLEIVCEWKADVNHPCVSAASILAKTTRDFEVEKIKKLVGQDFGSGYPSDPITKKFLKDYYAKHQKDGIFRETWGTVKDHKKGKAQKTLF
jgi:ribonuclease HII